jgi:hypothetical protein
MAPLKLQMFGGMMPAWDERLLPDGQAAYSRNGYLFSGSLIGWRQPKLLTPLKNGDAQYVFRIPNKVTNDTRITAPDSFWMEFSDPDTNVIHTPVADDQYDRYYFASPSQPPQYATYDMIMAGQNPWLLGVPGSGCAPGVTVTGGGDIVRLGFTGQLPDSGDDFRPGNSVFLIPVLTNGALIMQDVAFMPAVSDPTVNFQAVLYSDFNGAPYQRLGVGGNVTGITAGTAAISTFTNGISIEPDTTYWIGVSIDDSITVNLSAPTLTQGRSFSNTYSNGPPAAAGGVTVGFNWQMWADCVGEGQAVFEARAYVYTWVTEYGEEGPPSPPTVVNGWSNAVWEISLFTPDPLDMGVRRNIKKTRIYRTVTSAAGQGSYFFVAEVPVTQDIYEDISDDAFVANNAQMVSLFWSGPPEDMKGIEAMPNGIAVGFKSNEIWFSEAYRPHAWPPNYVLTTEFPIIGIGVTASMVVVCTAETPYVISGTNPATMAMLKINLTEPCLHRGSIVSTDTTVLYVSQNGLIQIAQSGAGANITEGWVSREKWQKLTPQKFIRAVKHTTSYFAFGTVSGSDNSVAQQGFTVELSSEDQTSFSIFPQVGGHRLGFEQLSAPNGFDIDNVELDAWTGVGLLVQGGGIWYFDFTDQAPIIVPCIWRSKIFQQLSKRNFAAVRVWFTVPPGTPAQNPVRNVNDPQPTLAPDQYAILRVYADGQLFTTREIRTSGELLRIYSGRLVEQWQFEFETRVAISIAQVGTTVKELGLV